MRDVRQARSSRGLFFYFPEVTFMNPSASQPPYEPISQEEEIVIVIRGGCIVSFTKRVIERK
jgi:hypothetical protein